MGDDAGLGHRGRRPARGRHQSSSDDIAQRNRFNHLIALQEQYGVSRLYYYNFQHQGGVNDRSLINTRVGNESEGVNTLERPIWNAIRCRPANECTWNRPNPIITTNAASGVTQTTAAVSGTVNAMGYDTGVNIEYGTTAAYGSTAYNIATIPDARTTAQPVSTTLTGLQPGTTYHYRIVALNLATGATYGADQTFTTAPMTGTLTRYAGSDHWATAGGAPAGWAVEMVLGFLAPDGSPGTTALYECLSGTDHFLSINPGCEGQQKLGSPGLIYTSESAAANVPLYRCVQGVTEIFESYAANCEGMTIGGQIGWLASSGVLKRYANLSNGFHYCQGEPKSAPLPGTEERTTRVRADQAESRSDGA